MYPCETYGDWAVSNPGVGWNGPDPLHGCEEEFEIVGADPGSRQLRLQPLGEQVRQRQLNKSGGAKAVQTYGPTLEPAPHVIEFQGDPVAATCVGHEIRKMRFRAAQAVAEVDGFCIAAGLPIPVVEEFEVVHVSRYERFADSEYGAMLRRSTGKHENISVPGRSEAECLDLGTRAKNWIKLVLPVITAVTNNSSFWDGRFTTYAGGRTCEWGALKTNQPEPYFLNWSQYKDYMIAALRSMHVHPERDGTYDLTKWHAEVRPRNNRIELRDGDPPLTVAESELATHLHSALVRWAVDQVLRHGPMPSEEQPLWAFFNARDLAAKGGMNAERALRTAPFAFPLLHPRTLEKVPAHELIWRTFRELLEPYLAADARVNRFCQETLGLVVGPEGHPERGHGNGGFRVARAHRLISISLEGEGSPVRDYEKVLRSRQRINADETTALLAWIGAQNLFGNVSDQGDRRIHARARGDLRSLHGPTDCEELLFGTYGDDVARGYAARADLELPEINLC